jgi:hypothetical protein
LAWNKWCFKGAYRTTPYFQTCSSTVSTDLQLNRPRKGEVVCVSLFLNGPPFPSRVSFSLAS